MARSATDISSCDQGDSAARVGLFFISAPSIRFVGNDLLRGSSFHYPPIACSDDMFLTNS
jgi:hypothetical protein